MFFDVNLVGQEKKGRLFILTSGRYIYDIEEYFCNDLTLASFATSLMFPVSAFELACVKQMSNCQYLCSKWTVLQLDRIGIGFLRSTVWWAYVGTSEVLHDEIQNASHT